MLKTKLAKTMYIISCICVLQSQATQAQTNSDTLNLSIDEAEKIFLDKNLALIAGHYGVEANKALVQQAKLWDNPVLNTDQNIYSNNKFFEHGKDSLGNPYGQYYVQLQQLIKTAGKRGKEIKIAKTNAEISEWQLKDLLKNLRLQLHSDFYTILQLLGNKQLYNEELEQLGVLLRGMEAQYNLGNIAKKDLLRVQALQINLQQEAIENDKQIADSEADLKTMLQMSGDVFIRPVAEGIIMPVLPELSIAQLIDLAKQNNTTYQLQQLQLMSQVQTLAYQKALAVPDITLGPNYDLNSNYTSGYVGLGVSLPLPVLNRNQGNIRSARWQVKQQETNLQQAELELQNSIQSAYSKLKYTLQLSSATQQSFYEDYRKLYKNVVQSYKDRQISMIEFVDYFDAYKDSRQKQLQQQLNLQLAKDELNMQVGTDVIK
jgi:cobalt-zinc-cadmium efflux system outer membrane protein